jgi:putative transposase
MADDRDDYSGEREILGIWAGDGGEGARFWLQALF